MIIIYSITFNGKIYVGSSRNYDTRKKTHLRALKNNRHHCVKLQRSFNAYPEYALIFTELESFVSKEEQYEREQKWLDKLLPYYNSSKSARGCKGHVHTKEELHKMSLASKGHVRTPEWCANISKALRGKTVSADTRAKISASNRGKKPVCSPEAKQRQSRKGSTMSVESKQLMSLRRKQYWEKRHAASNN